MAHYTESTAGGREGETANMVTRLDLLYKSKAENGKSLVLERMQESVLNRRQLGKSNQISADKQHFEDNLPYARQVNKEEKRRKAQQHFSFSVCEKPICHHWSFRAPEKRKTTHASNKWCTKARKRPLSWGDTVGRQISESYGSIHYLCLLRTA